MVLQLILCSKMSKQQKTKIYTQRLFLSSLLLPPAKITFMLQNTPMIRSGLVLSQLIRGGEYPVTSVTSQWRIAPVDIVTFLKYSHNVARYYFLLRRIIPKQLYLPTYHHVSSDVGERQFFGRISQNILGIQILPLVSDICASKTCF